MPSLDGFDEDSFKVINNPHPNITFEKLVQGLIAFRQEFKGKYWLEVFMIEGINTSDAQIEKFKEIIGKISPDKIQLNTAVRPTSHSQVRTVSQERLEQIAAMLGEKAEVIAKFSKIAVSATSESLVERIIATLKRRPCSSKGLAMSLGVSQDEVDEQIKLLLKKAVIRGEIKDDGEYFIVN
jgi:wyosine [tRNA(Phe)-imidazoG37] synthetase (radical SAM superfamily)